MNAMIRQAQKMQEDVAALQAELETREYDISAGGGMVEIKINGKKEVLSIHIKPEIVDPDDVETLEDIMVAAVNEAIKRVETTNDGEMQKLTGAMGMPGMF
jgi:DNA-binding YbaB/EbfC family protein